MPAPSDKIPRMRKAWAATAPLILICLLFSSAGDAHHGDTREHLVVHISSELDFQPYASVDNHGRPKGYAIDLIKAVARNADLDLVFRVGPWSQNRSELEAGKIDMVPFMTKSPERAKKVDFSDTHMIAYDAIFINVTAAKTVRSAEDLAGKRVWVLRGDYAEDYLRRQGKVAELLKTDSVADGLKLLSAGQGDAFVGSQVVGLVSLTDQGIDNVRLAKNPLMTSYSREYAFAVRKGDRELLTRLNEGLKAVVATGEYGMIYDKWFADLDPESRRRAEVQRRLMIGLLVASVIALLAIGTVVIFRRELSRKTTSLAESETRFRALVMNLPAAVFRIKIGSPPKVEYVSDAIESITGYPADDFVSARERTFQSLILPEDLPAVTSMAERAIRNRSDFRIDFRITDRFGKVHWIHSRGSMMLDADERPYELDGIFLDITDQKRVAELLTEQQSKMAASARLSALGEMAGGIAHEVNNPLAIINLRTHQLAQMADKGTLSAEGAKEIAASIEATTLRIFKIVRSLQAVARESKGDPFEDVPIRAILDETFELCMQRMKTHGVEIIRDDAPPDLKLTCRRVQISQILINLLNNAFDAVVGQAKPVVRVSVRELPDTDQIEISIADNGKGVPQDLAQKIFQPFFTTKGVGKGVGLGLSISKGLIESHGGEIWLDSSSGMTRFVIRLPKHQSPEAIKRSEGYRSRPVPLGTELNPV